MRGTITTRGKDRHLVRVFLGRDANGRQKFYSKVVRGTKRDAQRFLAARVAEQSSGKLVEPKKLSFGEYLADWLQGEARQRCRPNSWQTYVELIDRYVPDRLLARRLQSVSSEDLQQLLDDLSERGLSPSTVRQVAAALRSALRHASDAQVRLIAYNPAVGLRLPQPRHPNLLGPSRDQVSRLLKVLSRGGIPDLVLEVMLVFGLRPSEAVALRVSDLDLSRAELHVRRRIVRLRSGGGLHEDAPKSVAGNRPLAIPTGLFGRLAGQAEQVVEDGNGDSRFNPTRLLFPSSLGTPIHRSVLLRRLKRAASQAGLPPEFRMYDLRHAHATMLSDGGVPVRAIADQMGHANPSLTLKVYQHTTTDSRRLAAATFDAIYHEAEDNNED